MNVSKSRQPKLQGLLRSRFSALGFWWDKVILNCSGNVVFKIKQIFLSAKYGTCVNICVNQRRYNNASLYREMSSSGNILNKPTKFV